MEFRHGLPKTGGCYDGPRAFLQRAEPWLLEREAENNLVLGLADSLSRSTRGYESPLYFATVERAGEVQGCAFRTPPYKLGLTRMPVEAASLVASDVAEVYDSLPAVLGPLDVARRVGDAWAALKGVPVRPLHRPREPDLQPHLSGDWIPSHPGRDRRELRVSGGPGTPRAGSRHLDRPGSRK